MKNIQMPLGEGQNNSNPGSIFSRKILIQAVIHIVAWVVFFALLSILIPKPGNREFVLIRYLPFVFFVGYFYLNYLLIVPAFFMRGKYLLFFMICLGCLIIIPAIPSIIQGSLRPGPPPDMEFNIMQPPDQDWHPAPDGPGNGPPPDRRMNIFRPEYSYTFFVSLFLLALSVGMRVTIQWQMAEKEKATAELAFLKAQINPHFLFNTLNNIYSMSVTGSEKTPEAIERFSNIMRFVIYKTKADFIPLTEKMEYIRNYIGLQQLRLTSNVRFSFEVKGNPGKLQIAPLILMPFIENAFKYGVSTENPSVIEIAIEILDSRLNLRVSNLRHDHLTSSRVSSQTGIDNTLRRLNLIYPGRHSLSITDDGNVYVVSLQLDLR